MNSPLKIFKNRAGFTLIELLVVISIIGVLASVVLSSLESARAGARDAQRISDLRQIQTALEMYRNDHGFFPCENRLNCPGQAVNSNGIIGEGSGLDTLLAPYLPKIPRDPRGSFNNVTYRYYYDGAHLCGGNPNIIVLFAMTLETKTGNKASQPCTNWGGEGGSAASTNGQFIIIANSRG